MKLARSIIAIGISLTLAFLTTLPLATAVTAQDIRAALQRGYRTGYSDGYMSGYRDSIDNLGRDVVRHNEYGEANRAYNAEFGSLDDYRDGYRQGFESGYETGFAKRSFDSTVPANIARKGVSEVNSSEQPNEKVVAVIPQTETSVVPEPEAVPVETKSSVAIDEPAITTTGTNAGAIDAVAGEPASRADDARPIVNGVIKKASYISNDDPIIIIPRDTELIVELQEELSTEMNREGDKFTAKIISPVEIAGAMIEGRIDRIQKPGRIKRRSQIDLSFDRIVLTEERWSNFGAILTEVVAIKGDNIRRVDNEGTAIGKSSVKDDSIKIGAATGAGLGIGAIAGGPVGAAVGAGVGAAFGVGAAVVERGKHISLARNQQMKIKASFETKIR